MSRVLAPSTQGYKSQTMFGKGYWAPKPWPPNIETTWNPLVLASFKGPTTYSDFKSPTPYVRMIASLIPGGNVNAQSNTHRLIADTSLTVSLSNSPNGCSIPTGVVTCPTWMRDQVIQEAVLEANQFEANILEDLGQLRQTGQMIVDIFYTICKLFSDARKGRWGAVRRALRSKGVNIPRHMANGWLMYFYGIKPLIGTIDTLCSGQEPKYRTLKVRKRVEDTASAYSYTTAWYWVQFSNPIKVQVQCQIAAAIKLDGNLREWQKLGLTSSALTDAVVTAWALTPYSFVLDWVLPVERFLRSRSWGPFLEYQGGFVGIRHHGDTRFVDYWAVSGSYPSYGQLPNGTVRIRFYKREVYLYRLPPSFLSISLRLSSTQLTSAVALVIK